MYRVPISHRLFSRISTNYKEDREYLSSRLLSFVAPSARKKESGGDCVTTTEGILFLRLASCPVRGWPALFSLPDLFLCQLLLSLSLPSGPMLWFTDAAAALERKSHPPKFTETSLQICSREKGYTKTRMNRGHMSVKVAFFKTRPQSPSIMMI